MSDSLPLNIFVLLLGVGLVVLAVSYHTFIAYFLTTAVFFIVTHIATDFVRRWRELDEQEKNGG